MGEAQAVGCFACLESTVDYLRYIPPTASLVGSAAAVGAAVSTFFGITLSPTGLVIAGAAGVGGAIFSLEAAYTANKNKDLNRQLATSKEQVGRLQTALTQERENLATAANNLAKEQLLTKNLQEELTKLQGEVTDLQSKIDNLSRTSAALSVEEKKFETENAELKADAANFTKQIAQLKEENEALDGNLKAALQQQKEIQALLDDFRREMGDNSKVLSETQKVVTSLQSSLPNAQGMEQLTNLVTLAPKMAQAAQDLMHTMQVNSQVNDDKKHARIRADIKEREEELRKLNAAIAGLQAKQEVLGQLCQRMEADVKKLEGDIAQLEQDLQARKEGKKSLPTPPTKKKGGPPVDPTNDHQESSL